MTTVINGTSTSASAPAVVGDDSNSGVYFPSSDQVAIATNGTQAMLVNATQGVQFNYGISVGGTAPATEGSGVKFPATQVASSDANTLDDYEEGTWTPTVNLLGTVTYAQQTGRYIKVGRNVTVQAYLIYSSTDSTQDGSSMTVSGAPFLSASGATGTSCMMTERMFGVNSAAAPNIFHIGPTSSSATFQLYQNNYNGGIANASYFVSQQRSCYKGGNQYIYFSFSYEASS